MEGVLKHPERIETLAKDTPRITEMELNRRVTKPR